MQARVTEWRGPTNRILTPGATFKVRGRNGRWRFLAYVDSPSPHVEAVRASDGPGANVRCFDPSLIHSVSPPTGESQ